MTEEYRILKIFEPFILGHCVCGCNQELNTIYDYRWNTLRKFKHGHNTRGSLNPTWKGGRTIQSKTGYVLIKNRDHHFTTKNGYVMEHRLVYEEFYKCCLLRQTEIHHLNGIKDDNRIENLSTTDRSRHQSLHHTKYMLNRFCEICKSTETRIRKDGYVNWCYYNNDKTKFLCHKCYKRLRYNATKI